jgi:hypothetical protein
MYIAVVNKSEFIDTNASELDNDQQPGVKKTLNQVNGLIDCCEEESG